MIVERARSVELKVWGKVTLSGQSWQEASGQALHVWDGLGSGEKVQPGAGGTEPALLGW